jgi:hypothetical protein
MGYKASITTWRRNLSFDQEMNPGHGCADRTVMTVPHVQLSGVSFLLGYFPKWKSGL